MQKYYRSLDRLLAAAELIAAGQVNKAAQHLVKAAEEDDFDDMKADVNAQQAEAQEQEQEPGQQQQQKQQKQQQLSRALRTLSAEELDDDMEDGDDPDDMPAKQQESASARLRRNLRSRM